jgi:hypothetical protein
MVDSILVSVLSGGLAGAAASVFVVWLKERYQRRRDRLDGTAALHSKIEEVPHLVRALQRATEDSPGIFVNAIDKADYYAARERSAIEATETLDRALSAVMNSARRLGPNYVEAAAQVRDAARLAASAEDGSEQQSRNHVLEQRCEQACSIGFK